MKNKIIFFLLFVMVLSFSMIVYANESSKMVTIKAGKTSVKNGDISLGYDIEMSQYEVTFNEYIEFCNDTGKSIPNDEGWGKGSRPVINVSWYDAVEYCNWLSEKEGLIPAYDISGSKNNWELKKEPQNTEGYRLPTANEWTYAAHGGKDGKNTTYAGSNNIDLVAWYDDNTEDKTHLVGKKQVNELGIYDMSGNVYEWTNTSVGSLKVYRGGGWIMDATVCEVVHWYSTIPSDSYNFLGFRLSKTK